MRCAPSHRLRYFFGLGAEGHSGARASSASTFFKLTANSRPADSPIFLRIVIGLGLIALPLVFVSSQIPAVAINGSFGAAIVGAAESGLPEQKVAIASDVTAQSREFSFWEQKWVAVAALLVLQTVLIAALGQKCILVASSDISARKALEENLRLSEREFSTLVHNSPDIISRLDQNLRYIYISPTSERVTGVPPECFIGKTPGELGLADYDWQGFELCCRQAILMRKASQRGFDYNGRSYWTRVIPEFTPEGLVESLMTISEDVTDRIQAERELTKLTVRLFHLQDEERRRIARELHDVTAQNLFAISINLAKLNELRLPESDESRACITESQSLIDQSLQEIRTLSYVLHPPLLDHAGLVSALQWYVDGFSKRSGIYVELVAQAIDRLPSEMEMALFRVVQEALTNVRRHSGSEIVNIRLERKAAVVLPEISDHGRGLQTKEDEDSNGLGAIGVGIPGMRQRLRQLGGALEITSNGRGTTISAVVPLTNGVNHVAYSSRRRS